MIMLVNDSSDDFFERHRNRDFGPKSKKIESSILPSQSYDFHECKKVCLMTDVSKLHCIL